MIDFVAQLFDMTLSDAARKLANDSGMDAPPPSRSAMLRPQTPCIAKKTDIWNETKEPEELYDTVLCDYYPLVTSVERAIYADISIGVFIEALRN